jgi:hypothetical protein
MNHAQLFRRGLLAFVAALVATLASSLVPGRVRIAYPGSMDCQQGCEFVAAGWPFSYLVDNPGISPVGSVSLVEGLLGVDIVRPGPLVATFLFWLAIFGVAMWLGTRHASRHSGANTAR